MPVRRVTRKDGKAVHFIEAKQPLTAGDLVLQKVNWHRRFDHMQQHSGQHLISALFEQLLNLPTLSWWMAENSDGKVGFSYIELDAENIDQSQMDQIEQAANEAIANAVPVQTHIYPSVDSEELKSAKTRGLPNDHVGPVRVIDIQNIDQNMCCGTHVNNLSQLQMVKLLHSEKSKRKGKTFVYFLVGHRVTLYLSATFKREKEMTSILNGGAEFHCSLAEKALNSAKKYQKQTKNLLKELALLKANELKSEKPKYFSTHRPEKEMEFCNVLLSELSDLDITIFVTMGNDKEEGCSLVLQSDNEEVIKNLSKKILQTLNASGGGKGKRINGKFTSLEKRNDVDTILRDYFADLNLDG